MAEHGDRMQYGRENAIGLTHHPSFATENFDSWLRIHGSSGTSTSMSSEKLVGLMS